MIDIPKKQASETFLIGALLALTGGFTDAYTYLIRGKVFANAQTGNMVLLAVRAAEGNWSSAFYYLIPIFSFFIGVIISDFIRRRFSAKETLHWRQITVCLEMVVLAIVGFIPKDEYDAVANILVSFACSVQVQSFRKLYGSPYSTTMCTGNLRSAAESVYHFLVFRDKSSLRFGSLYLGIIGIFILGALIGAYLTEVFSVASIFFCCALLAAVFLLMFRK